MKSLLRIGAALMVLAAISLAQTPAPLINYTETFDGMTGSSVPSNWRIVRSPNMFRTVPPWNTPQYSTTVDQVVTSYPINPGSDRTFNCYDDHYMPTTDRALGFRQRPNAYSQVAIAWYYNNTPGPLTDMRITFKVEKYYMDTNPAGTNIKFYYTYNPNAQFSESLMNPDPAYYWVGVGNGYTSTPDANNNNPTSGYPLMEVNRQADITGVYIPPNGSLYLAVCFSIGDPTNQGGNNAQNSQIWALDDFQIDNLVPVELVSFNALYKDGNVYLTWKTATEADNYGFEVERSTDRENWSTIGFVEGAGTVNSPRTYSFVDAEDLAGLAVVHYRLRQIDRDGSIEYSPVVSVSISQDAFLAMRSFPNPFNPTTTISFTLPAPETVTLVIFDASGKEVTRLLNNAPLNAGMHSMVFDAAGLSSGVYFAHLVSSTGVTSHRLVLSR